MMLDDGVTCCACVAYSFLQGSQIGNGLGAQIMPTDFVWREVVEGAVGMQSVVVMPQSQL